MPGLSLTLLIFLEAPDSFPSACDLSSPIPNFWSFCLNPSFCTPVIMLALRLLKLLAPNLVFLVLKIDEFLTVKFAILSSSSSRAHRSRNFWTFTLVVSLMSWPFMNGNYSPSILIPLLSTLPIRFLLVLTFIGLSSPGGISLNSATLCCFKFFL